MVQTVQIGLIGDYSAEVLAHIAIPKALAIAANDLSIDVTVSWLPTDRITNRGVANLSEFDGLWCVPASPYVNMDGALTAIRFARETKRPFLGTCGGFQHALIEYARNVWGLAEADHAESNPNSELALITPLSCSLVEAFGSINLIEGSWVKSIYGRDDATEQFHCSFGFNPRFHSMLENGDLRVAGTDPEGELRIVELDKHPFFIATLFQPERSALSGKSHPLIQSFLRAALTFANQRNSR